MNPDSFNKPQNPGLRLVPKTNIEDLPENFPTFESIALSVEAELADRAPRVATVLADTIINEGIRPFLEKIKEKYTVVDLREGRKIHSFVQGITGDLQYLISHSSSGPLAEFKFFFQQKITDLILEKIRLRYTKLFDYSAPVDDYKRKLTILKKWEDRILKEEADYYENFISKISQMVEEKVTLYLDTMLAGVVD
jgi:hypothetical protein